MISFSEWTDDRLDRFFFLPNDFKVATASLIVACSYYFIIVIDKGKLK